MNAPIDKQLEKYRRRYADACTEAADAVTEAGLRAATHVVQSETAAPSEQAVRAQLKREAVARKIIDGSGRLMNSVLRTTLPDPWLPEAFDVAVFNVGKLFCTAWNAGVKR